MILAQFHIITFWILRFLFETTFAQTPCFSNYVNSSEICTSGHNVGERMLLDFSHFESVTLPSCSCTIYLLSGNKMDFNPVSFPGYPGCGTAVQIRHKYVSTIRCVQAAESLDVSPGDAVTIEISKEGQIINSKYCFLLHAYEYKDKDKIPGSMAVVCEPPQMESSSYRSSLSTSYTSDAAEQEVTTSNQGNVTNGKALTEHTENRDLAQFPWEIITPVSLVFFIIIVVIVIFIKVHRRRILKSTYKPSTSTRATSWAFATQKMAPSPKVIAKVKSTIEKTDSGVYSTLGNDAKLSRGSLSNSRESCFKEVDIDKAIAEAEAKKKMNENKAGEDNEAFVDDEDQTTVIQYVNSSQEESLCSATERSSALSNYLEQVYSDKIDNTFNETRSSSISSLSSLQSCDKCDHYKSYYCQTSKELLEQNLTSEEIQTKNVASNHMIENVSHDLSLPVDNGYVIIDVLTKI